MRYDRLFLAGDPAQSIVEGIDFRFKEVRGIVYALSQQTVKIHSPVTLKTNYRCHAGILNCASGVLDFLLTTFPHAANKLPRDQGLCGGPRPEYFADTGAGAGAGAGAFLRRLLAHNPCISVLCRDEHFQDGESLSSSELSQLAPEETLALGIRASKGMEFPDVLLLSFFCDLPADRRGKRRPQHPPADGDPAEAAVHSRNAQLRQAHLRGDALLCCGRCLLPLAGGTAAGGENGRKAGAGTGWGRGARAGRWERGRRAGRREGGRRAERGKGVPQQRRVARPRHPAGHV